LWPDMSQKTGRCSRSKHTPARHPSPAFHWRRNCGGDASAAGFLYVPQTPTESSLSRNRGSKASTDALLRSRHIRPHAVSAAPFHPPLLSRKPCRPTRSATTSPNPAPSPSTPHSPSRSTSPAASRPRRGRRSSRRDIAASSACLRPAPRQLVREEGGNVS